MEYITVKSNKKGRENYCSVYARVRDAGINRKYSLGFLLLQSEWNVYIGGTFDTKTVMQSMAATYGTFSNALEKIRRYFDEDFNQDEADAAIRRILDSVVKFVSFDERASGVGGHGILLADYLEQYLWELKTGQRLKHRQSVPLSKSHIHVIAAVRNNVVKYEETVKRRFALNDVDMDFQRGYVGWNIARGLSANTLNDYMHTIRLVMQAAYNSKLTKNDAFRNPCFVPQPKKVDNVVISVGQVEQMLAFDLTTPDIALKVKAIRMRDHGNIRLPDVQLAVLMKQLIISRDAFAVGCLTGQRYSDYGRITKDMLVTLKDVSFIKLYQRKTGKKVFIPLDYRVLEILNRYGGEIPYQSRNIFNRNIRIIGELLGWTGKVELNGKERLFYECLSSHTARRSFATNAFIAGIPISSILAVTGHSREEHLRRYLQLDIKERGMMAARDMQVFMKLK